ncbi:MAG: hypothetical protein WC306_00990 [Candidatus Paceibacterota bacterium]|jgi:hypothetical protein
MKNWDISKSLFLFTMGMQVIDKMLKNKKFAKKWDEEIERETTYVEIIEGGETYTLEIKKRYKTLLRVKKIATTFFNKKRGYEPTRFVKFGQIIWNGKVF